MDGKYLELKKMKPEENTKHFYHINKKYGINSVPAEKTYQVFEETIQPTKLGFIRIKRGRYAKIVNDDIVHLLKLQALKGKSYTIQWGISLSYFPHEYKKNIRWHKSFNSSRFDLFYFGHESSFSESDEREYSKRLIRTMNGEKYLKETTKTMWSELHKTVMNWFASTLNLNGVLEKADEQIKLNFYDHYPNPLLVYAFTLKRLGRVNEANRVLSQFFILRNESVEVYKNLEIAIGKIQPSLE